MNPLMRTAAAGYRDSVAYFGAAQSGKTNGMIRVALDLPGALFATSTRGALALATMIARSKKGPVWLADPTGEGGFPTNLIASPLLGCRDYRMATSSAGELVHAMPRDAHNTGIIWDRKAATLLKYLMHAAAWEPGATMLDVQAWAGDRGLWDIPAKILQQCRHAVPGWAGELAEIGRTVDQDPEHARYVSFSASTALEWLSDPAMEAIAGGPPGEAGELDVAEFLTRQGTLHLVAGNKPHNPVAPYFAWLLSYVFTAGHQLVPGGIIDPPCAVMLDEPKASCPVDLTRYLVEAAGWGFPFIAGFQSYSQLAEAYGDAGALTVSNNFTMQVYLGGTQEPAHLERVSKMGGEEDTWEWERHPGTRRKTRKRARRQVFTPERIGQLQQGEVFVKPRACRAFTGRIPPAQDHPLYEMAGPGTYPVQPAVVPRRAIVSPRRALPPPQRLVLTADRSGEVTTWHEERAAS